MRLEIHIPHYRATIDAISLRAILFFRQSWVQTGSSTPARDGLGPTYNAVSCSACHFLDGRGQGIEREGFAHVSLLFRLEGAQETYGGQLNPLGIQGVPGEARPNVAHVLTKGQFQDGEEFELREPLFTFTDWILGEPPSTTRISARVANQLIGLGLLEQIPQSEIEALADPTDNDNDSISGRASYVLNMRTGEMTLGRFGWKAEQPTVEQQNAAAFLGDMGLTTSLFPVENCPTPQLACQAAPQVDRPKLRI